MSDEAYYWDWSRRLALGYFDHPPMVAWLIKSSSAVLGITEFGVRFWWAVLGTALVVLAYEFGRRAVGQTGGVLAALLILTGPPFIATSGLATPDGLVLFWWAVTLVLLQVALREGRYRPWLACGLAFGCGLESKYTAVLLLPAIFLAMAATSRGRWWLRRPAPYAGVAVAALVFAPNVFWNATHGWVTMSFQLGHGQAQAADSLASWDQMQAYLAVQAGIVMPYGLVLYACATLGALVIGLRRDDTMLLTLGLSALGTFACFLLLNGMYHWTLPAYLSAALACGVLGGRLIDGLAGRRVLRMVATLAAAILLLGSALPSGLIVGALVAGRPVVSVDADLIQELVDTTRIGPGVGQQVADSLRTPAYNGPGKTQIIAESYGTAAFAAFYAPGHPRVYGPDHQYGLWGDPPLCNTCRLLDLGS
jgi:4-amino-4-deoxy-L-arabinose transferase-like glycosyltransferase